MGLSQFQVSFAPVKLVTSMATANVATTTNQQSHLRTTLSSSPHSKFSSRYLNVAPQPSMSDLTPSSSLRVELHKDGRKQYAQFFCRTFQCGHPDELIESWQDNDGQLVHNLLTNEVYEACTLVFQSRREYVQVCCLDCAKKVKEKEDQYPRLHLKGQGLSFRFDGESFVSRQSGFDSALERHRYRITRGIGVQPHPPISEDEHQIHRLEAQAQARSGKRVLIPARRTLNAPIQSVSKVQLEIHKNFISYLFEEEDKSFFEAKIAAALENNYYAGNDSTRNNSPLGDRNSETLSIGSIEAKQDNERIREHETILRTENDDQEEVGRLSLARASENKDESPQTVANNMSPSEESETPEKLNNFVSDCPTVNGGDDSLYLVKTPTSSERGSAFVKHLMDLYAPPLAGPSDSSLADSNSKHACLPAALKRGPLSFIKRRSSTSTQASTSSKPKSKNLHKLRLEPQHSARDTNKTDSDNQSPDWACRTSLAIEAGRVLMDGVSLRSTTSIAPTERSTLQGVRPAEWYNSSSPPSTCSSEHCVAPSILSAHSERAFQADTRRMSAAHPSESLNGMEIGFQATGIYKT